MWKNCFYDRDHKTAPEKAGLLNGEQWGYLRFVLPMFEQFVLENYEM